jgi:hypothetical protein
MSIGSNDRATMAAVLAIWNGASTTGLAELLAPDYRGHVLGVPNGERDGAAYPGSIARYRAAFPGVEFHVVEQFAADDRLVTRLEARRPGTDGGPGSISHGMNISRFDAGARLSEEWAIWSAWQDVRQEAMP